jgi:hypothetical protein
LFFIFIICNVQIVQRFSSIIMNQIRIFTASNQISVMEEVNEFLKDLEQNKLIDIKYSMVVKGNEIFYSAMMMYEEDENNEDINFDTLE